MKAARRGKTDVVVELVKGGANLDLQNKVCIVMNTGYRSLLSLSHTCFNFLLCSLFLTIKQFPLLYGYCSTFNLAFEYILYLQCSNVYFYIGVQAIFHDEYGGEFKK